jgi:hypothetical protein
MSINTITVFHELSKDINDINSKFLICFYDKGDSIIVNISHSIREFYYNAYYYINTNSYSFGISKSDLENKWSDLYLRWQLSLLFTLDIPTNDICDDYIDDSLDDYMDDSLTIKHLMLFNDLTVFNKIFYTKIPFNVIHSNKVKTNYYSWIDIKDTTSLPPLSHSDFLIIFNNYFLNNYINKYFNNYIDKLDTYFSKLSSRKSAFLSLNILTPDLLSYIFFLSIS